MSIIGAVSIGEFSIGDFDGDFLSVADTLQTLLERPELPRSWWLRAYPLDTEFDLFLRIDPSFGYVDFGNILDPVSVSFSVQVRVRRDTQVDNTTLLGKAERVGVAYPGYSISIVNKKVQCSISDGTFLRTGTASQNANSIDFETYTMVVDRSANELQLYRGNTLQGFTDISTVGSLSNSFNMYLGRVGADTINGCDVDELRFWSKALTSTDIDIGGDADYSVQLDTASLPASLLLYCQMNEGSGAVLTDETANNNDGAISNSTFLPATVNVNLSTDGHRTYPTDKEEIQLEQAVIAPYSLSYSLPAELFGQVDTDFGEIVIDNSWKNYNHLAVDDWTGRQADVYIGPRFGTMVQFTKVGELLSRGLSYDRSKLTLIVDDRSFIFDRPLQSNFYGGTGGLDGGTEIAGQPKPIWIGIKRQVEPVLVDSANLIYQVHDGSLGSFNSVDAVKDQGVALSFDADYADITTAIPGVGEYSTSLATGHIKLNAKNGKITVDGKGWEFPSYGYADDVATIIKGLAVDVAGLLDPVNLDPLAFATLATHTASMGDYFGSPTTIRAAMNIFHRSAYSWGWLKPNNVLTVGRITDPDSASVDFTVDKSKEEINLQPFRFDPYELPVGRVIVGYRRYPAIMVDSELDASVSAATRYDYSQEYRYETVEDAAVFARFPDAREIVILTDLDTSSDAAALGAEQLALRKVVNRRLGTIALRTGLISRGIGQIMQLTDDNLPVSPKNFVVIGVVNRASAQSKNDDIQLQVFG